MRSVPSYYIVDSFVISIYNFTYTCCYNYFSFMLLLSDSDGFCSENFVRDEVAWVTDNCVKIL